MPVPTLEALVDAMRAHGCVEADISEGGTRLHVRLAPEAQDAQAATQATRGMDAPALALSPEMGVFRVRHPDGTFGPAPGDAVATGTILGFVAVGPALLPVTAPCAGRLDTVLGQDGAIVGYHTPLFAITHG